LTGSQS